MERVGAAVEASYRGDREEAWRRLAALWAELHPDGDAWARCTLAHYMADLQDEARDELLWDRHAPRSWRRCCRGMATAT